MSSDHQKPRRVLVALVTGIPLAAAAAGGATSVPVQCGVLILIAGCLLVAAPDRPQPVLGLLALALLALMACAWLPRAWFADPPWRLAVEQAGIPTGSVLSPQPWVSLQAAVLGAGGIAWAWWVLGRTWSRAEIEMAGRWMCRGLAILALLACAVMVAGWQVPLWQTDAGLGPFPNRNHSGSLFAMGSILAAASAFTQWRRGRRGAAVLETVAFAVLAMATACSYSRAAAGGMLAGLALWLLAGAWLRRSRYAFAGGAAVLLAVCGLFLLFGGGVVERFAGRTDSDTRFRLCIYRDTLAMIRQGSWCGMGVGNFEALFPLHRQASVAQNRVLHPESDWLWLAAELGPAALLVVALALVLALHRLLPFARGSARFLRLGAGCAAAGFALHGLVDVPGHRLGAVLPALLLLSLAGKPAVPVSPGRTVRSVSCAGALLLCGGAGLLWVGRDPMPRALAAWERGDWQACENLVTRALASRVLDWRFYYLRGVLRARHGAVAGALVDFDKARVLEPHYVRLPMREAEIWLGIRPALAVRAWAEALRRCRPPDAPELFGQMVAASVEHPELWPALWGLTGQNAELQLRFLEAQPPGSAAGWLDEMQAFVAGLGPPQQRRLAWVRARALAARGDFQAACELVLEFTRQEVPMVEPRPLAAAERAFLRNPRDPLAAFACYQAQAAAGDMDGALATLNQMALEPWCPAYVHQLRARLLADRNDWAAAWEALNRAR